MIVLFRDSGINYWLNNSVVDCGKDVPISNLKIEFPEDDYETIVKLIKEDEIKENEIKKNNTLKNKKIYNKNYNKKIYNKNYNKTNTKTNDIKSVYYIKDN